MESGRVKVDQKKKQYDFEIKGRKYFPRATRLTGYPNLYSQDSGNSSCPDTQKLNSWMYLRKSCPSIGALPGTLELPCVCLLNRCGNEILLKRSMSKRIQMLGVGKKDVNAQLEGVSEMKVFGGMALMLLLSIIPTIASVNATNEGSYWYG